MGSCCSKRSRRDGGEVHIGALHPSLENWKVRKRPGLAEFKVAGNESATEHIVPVMRVKPSSKPSFGFPSIHYNVNANLLCDSTHSSSRSLGGHLKHQSMRFSISSSNPFDGDKATILSNQHISTHHCGLSLSSRRHNLPDNEPAENHDVPPFSFVTQPYIEPDFFNTAFAFHPSTIQNFGLTGMNINPSDGVKLKVRHKHMFPQDFLGLHELPAMKRSKSDGKLTAEEGCHDSQPHRRSFQDTLTGYGWFDLSTDMIELAHDGIPTRSVDAPPMLAHTRSNIVNESSDDDAEGEDGYLDINLKEGISAASHARFVHANEQTAEDIKYCIRMGTSSQSKADLSMHPNHHDASSTALSMPQTMRCFSGREDECLGSHGNESMVGNITTMQPFAVVSTGDAVLFSGSNMEELHLIPSKFVPQSHSAPSSLRVNLSPLKLNMATCNNEGGDETSSNLSIEDIITMLESDEVNEDELLSLLINAKSPSMSPTALSPTSMLSISSMSTSSLLLPSSSDSMPRSPMSSSPLSSSSSSSASSSPPSLRLRPPYPSKASASYSQSLLTSMQAVMLPFSTPKVSASVKGLPQCSSSRKVSPTSSFEFKVKSCNSAASTPMFSPIRSAAKRNIAQLKPTALTTEEIAEIWGVFEQRQALVTPH